MDECNSQRRKFLLYGGAALALTLVPKKSFASLAISRPRVLTLNNINTGETLKTEFFNGSGYDEKELIRLNHFFRDYRAGEVKRIDPRLFDQLYRLQSMLETHKPVQLISGYRTLLTNNRLRARTKGVAKNSYHTLGQALDFHIEGILLSRVKKAALSMRTGGVGYYPRSNFVHIDTGPVRTW